MREIRVGDNVRVFGLWGKVIGIDMDLYQIEICGTEQQPMDGVVFAPARDVFLDVWGD